MINLSFCHLEKTPANLQYSQAAGQSYLKVRYRLSESDSLLVWFPHKYWTILTDKQPSLLLPVLKLDFAALYYNCKRKIISTLNKVLSKVDDSM